MKKSVRVEMCEVGVYEEKIRAEIAALESQIAQKRVALAGLSVRMSELYLLEQKTRK